MNFKRKFVNFLHYFTIIGFILAISSLILEYGFYSINFRNILHLLQIVATEILTFIILGRFVISKNRLEFIKNNRGYLILILFFLLTNFLIYFGQLPKNISFFSVKTIRIDTLIFTIQLYLIFYIIFSLSNANQLIVSIKGTVLRPILLIPLTFAVVILIGTLLLLTPKAVNEGPISFLDALFTATSATCVTGLIVHNTATYFSRLGQVIILILFQIGGLGIMTFTTFFSLIMGRRLGIREQAFLGETLSLKTLPKVGRLVIAILAFTFVVEIIGAGILYFEFIPYFGANLHNVYLSVFHSVSAFCNAGFSLFGKSFIRFQNNLGVNFVMTTLIILGGLGFMVIFDIIRWLRAKAKKQKGVLLLHSKIVIVMTLILIVAGTLIILYGEYGNTLTQFSLRGKLLTSYFQSVTARTAGFNTLPIGQFTPFTALILMMLMFIGASSGGTGGGIKTSTFVVLLVSVRDWFLGRKSVSIFRRTIPRLIIRQAFSIFIVVLIWITISCLILVHTEKASFLNVLFEEISAFGTVGLSRGITFGLTSVGKIVIIMTMFFGRVSPLMIALYIGKKGIKEKYRYPEGKIIIG